MFAYDTCYPDGGWNDFKGSFDTEEEAIDKVNMFADGWQNVHIIDTQTNEKTNYQ